jgi:hypothetical protein
VRIVVSRGRPTSPARTFPPRSCPSASRCSSRRSR